MFPNREKANISITITIHCTLFDVVWNDKMLMMTVIYVQVTCDNLGSGKSLQLFS